MGKNSSLATHALKFHAQELGYGETDWHVHFLMPEDLLPLEGSDGTYLPHGDEPPIGWAVATAFGNVNHSFWSLGQADALQVGCVDCRSQALVALKLRLSRVPWNGFLQSVCGCADSRAILCVRLC